MEQYSDLFIGLDTSKLKISVAVADGERSGEVRFFGDISSEPGAVAAMVAKLAKWLPHRWCPSVRVTGSRPTAATRSVWRGCIALVN